MAAQREPLNGSRAVSALAVAAAALSLAACATAPPSTSQLSSASSRVRAYNRPYEVRGRWYTPAEQPGYDRVGLASWYSYESRSRTTADGEPFDARLATAAHTTLPIPSWLEVTNLDNGRSARVRLNDRGPFVQGRILDLSRGAAEELGFLQRGTARVRVRYLGPAEPLAGAPRVMWASAPPPRRRRPAAQPRITLAAAAVAGPAPLAAAPLTAADEVAPASMSFAEAAPPTLAQAEVDKDLADFGGDDRGAPSVQGPATPSADAAGYAVQAGAFADRDNAERAVARLAEAGQAEVLPLERGDGEMLYRVLVGDWSEPQAADEARARIAALGYVDARVVGR